jgi:hypothetical protein
LLYVGQGEGCSGAGIDDGGYLTKVQCKSTWNCHNKSPVQQIYPNKKGEGEKKLKKKRKERKNKEEEE